MCLLGGVCPCRALDIVNAVGGRCRQLIGYRDATRKLAMTPPMLLPVGHRSCAPRTSVSAAGPPTADNTWPVGHSKNRGTCVTTTLLMLYSDGDNLHFLTLSPFLEPFHELITAPIKVGEVMLRLRML